ncbi:hypothetical protein B0H66DRAFT_91768 [Apodospora peruviana]|uniref:Uncharacterized protein n=1 Tax=Apodospora peruviana TaxID=516989 RepID=A0AAE0IV88_9PEZI|nr:hypothetical protein B0H66DRAFT_91768 [Apodospora peruviana]
MGVLHFLCQRQLETEVLPSYYPAFFAFKHTGPNPTNDSANATHHVLFRLVVYLFQYNCNVSLSVLDYSKLTSVCSNSSPTSRELLSTSLDYKDTTSEHRYIGMLFLNKLLRDAVQATSLHCSRTRRAQSLASRARLWVFKETSFPLLPVLFIFPRKTRPQEAQHTGSPKKGEHTCQKSKEKGQIHTEKQHNSNPSMAGPAKCSACGSTCSQLCHHRYSGKVSCHNPNCYIYHTSAVFVDANGYIREVPNKSKGHGKDAGPSHRRGRRGALSDHDSDSDITFSNAFGRKPPPSRRGQKPVSDDDDIPTRPKPRGRQDPPLNLRRGGKKNPYAASSDEDSDDPDYRAPKQNQQQSRRQQKPISDFDDDPSPPKRGRGRQEPPPQPQREKPSGKPLVFDRLSGLGSRKKAYDSDDESDAPAPPKSRYQSSTSKPQPTQRRQEQPKPQPTRGTGGSQPAGKFKNPCAASSDDDSDVPPPRNARAAPRPRQQSPKGRRPQRRDADSDDIPPPRTSRAGGASRPRPQPQPQGRRRVVDSDSDEDNNSRYAGGRKDARDYMSNLFGKMNFGGDGPSSRSRASTSRGGPAPQRRQQAQPQPQPPKPSSSRKQAYQSDSDGDSDHHHSHHHHHHRQQQQQQPRPAYGGADGGWHSQQHPGAGGYGVGGHPQFAQHQQQEQYGFDPRAYRAYDGAGHQGDYGGYGGGHGAGPRAEPQESFHYEFAGYEEPDDEPQKK